MSQENRTIEELRDVFLVGDAGTTYSLPIWRVNELMKKFLRAAHKESLSSDRPRIAIAGWLDFMWLRAAITRPWENETAWTLLRQYDAENPKLYGLDLPKHFQFRGIVVFEGKNETGWVFA
jgi:hypothetical protein